MSEVIVASDGNKTITSDEARTSRNGEQFALGDVLLFNCAPHAQRSKIMFVDSRGIVVRAFCIGCEQEKDGCTRCKRNARRNIKRGMSYLFKDVRFHCAKIAGAFITLAAPHPLNRPE